MEARWILIWWGRPECSATWKVVVPVVRIPAVRERTFAMDFEGLPVGCAAQTEPRRGCGTRPMGVRTS